MQKLLAKARQEIGSIASNILHWPSADYKSARSIQKDSAKIKRSGETDGSIVRGGDDS